MRKALYALAVASITFVALAPTRAQPVCTSVNDPDAIVAQVKASLHSGYIAGFALEGKEAVAFAKGAKISYRKVRGVLILKGVETRIGFLFEPIDGQFAVCIGAPTGEVFEAIRKLGHSI